MTNLLYKTPNTEPTFKSKSLDRVVRASELSQLDESQLRALHVELLVAVPALEDALGVASRSNDKDWTHRIGTKLRVCNAFITHVKELLDKQRSEEATHYVVEYLKHLERVLEDEVGPFVAEQMRQEARQAAQREVGAPAQTPAAPVPDA